MKAPVSLCMISRDDPHLEQCLLSLKEHVQEICVVLTSDKDTQGLEVCQRLADKYEIFTDCNDPVTDKIIDFSMARNKSLALATQPWLFWADSDDIIVGAEHLSRIIASYDISRTDIDVVQFLFPYEYGYDANGICTLRHYRERLVLNKNNNYFINPVHEVMVAKPGLRLAQIKCDDVVFKHQRQFNPKPQDPGRNLRILQKHFENPANSNDVRNKYYIGLEYSNHNDLVNATKWLTEYIERSGWQDEQAMACIKMVEISERQGNYRQGITFAFRLLDIKYNWFESYYCLCRMYYYLNQWDKCVHYGKLALQQPPTETLLFVNLAERYHIHTYLNVALNHVGDVSGALDSVLQGLKGMPDQPHLLSNKPIYEKYLGINQEVKELVADNGKLSIVFVTHPSIEAWSPETVKKTGIGGSEMMLINQAKNLAALGHMVKVYAAAEGTFDGVEYIPFTKFGNLACDVLIVSRYAQFLDDRYNVQAKLNLLWCHDVIAHGATNELLLKADRILALSEWHKDFMVQHMNVHPDQVIVTRNGIDLQRFTQDVVRNPYKIVNSSSPDRSWPVLLELFPKIRQQVPQAELHLYYGFKNWKAMAGHDPLQMELINKLESTIANTAGVVFHDRVSQAELSKEFLSAGVWCFPTWFTETSCITAMEARAADLHIVTSNLAALKETCAGYDKATLIDGAWTDKAYQEQFIEATVKALKDGH